MHVRIDIWLGVKLPADSNALPQLVWDQIDRTGYIDLGGLRFELFTIAGEVVGFGTSLASHVAETGPTLLDLSATKAQADELRPAVVDVLQAWMTTHEPELYITANWDPEEDTHA